MNTIDIETDETVVNGGSGSVMQPVDENYDVETMTPVDGNTDLNLEGGVETGLDGEKDQSHSDLQDGSEDIGGDGLEGGEDIAGDGIEGLDGSEGIVGDGMYTDGMFDAGMFGDGMGMETGTTVKDPILSNWAFVICIPVLTLAIGVGIGILLAKLKIKKGIDPYED